MFVMEKQHYLWVLSGIAVAVVHITAILQEDHYEVRLQGGDRNGTTGRVEVRRNASEEWGSVCDDLWTEREAQVVCRQLGYKWGTAHSNSPFGEGSGPIYLDNVQCTGHETSLSHCQSNGWGVHNCKHYEDAGVSCYNHSVRLKSRGVTNVGTVEIRTTDGWVQVCDDEWSDVDARVVCREQNYSYGKSLRKSKLGKMSTSDSVSTMSFYRFNCEGTETKLKDCSHQNRSQRCDTLARASAICMKEPMNNSFAIRFVQPNGDPVPSGTTWGEISVRRFGIWGQVCGSGTDWNDKSAKVACKQMGFAGGRAYGTVNETLRPIWITKLNCSGNEVSLEECVQDADSWGHPVHSCRPAYALCFRNDLKVSLAGNGSYFGRVQITYDGVTGTVCDDAWSSSDARVLCKSLGFNDGEPIQNSYYGPGTGPVMMNGLSCYGYENSIFQCRNNGWMVYNNTKCSSHAHDASVICYKEVRLSRGDHSHGVVQIMDQYWSVLCGEGFDEKDALVICKRLGFQHGRSLPKGTFGTFYGRYSRPNVGCIGNESSILDCSYDKMRGCQRENYLGYAAVSCYNGSINSNLELKLSGPTNQTGRVSIKKYGIWGRICPSAWDDKDADVVCRQLRYTGGVAYQDTSSGSGPYFLGEVNCHGNESALFNCTIGGEECDSQYSSGTAGVLCYRNRKPKLQLVGGTKNSGRLEIIMDDEIGSICDVGWSRYDATVACKQMNFTDGEFKRGLPGPYIPKFLSGMNCFGGESSIFMCRSRGWKQSIPEECSQPNRNAGVFCYNNVRISSGQSEDNATTGQVEMYRRGSWVTVCADGFDDADARVVCRELGFPYSKKLVPGAFGSKYYTTSIINLNCSGNEESIKDCSFSEGTCPRRSYNYASIICSKQSVDNSEVRLLPPNEFPETLLVEKYGINGTICAEDWNEKSATVACKQLAYDGGVPFGPRYYSSRTPIWMSSVNCTGSERSINQCQRREMPISETCLSSRLAARVFCYRGQGFDLRLNGTDRNDYSGRVEISYNGVWGTICDSYWSNNDARVVCRQLGFVDGVAEPRGKYGKGMGPSWLYYVRCDGNEKAIWECSNSGWNVTHTSCRAHDYDASVYCTGKVRLEPNITFGAVEIWQDSEYALVCADEFDDVDAQVVCHSLGFQNGISICCSVFDDSIMLKYPISITNVQCTGQESSILQCNYRTNIDACQSRKYASVACSNSESSGAYELRLSEEYKGVVEVRHLNIWGTICPNGFDNKDAKVICRELGYQDGFSYYEHEFTSGDRQSLPWLSNLNCTGAEGYLARCGNIRWGDVRNCSSDTKAAVYCLDNANIPIRLTNGTSLRDGNRHFANTSGRVEVSINNQWGTICGTSYWDDEDATVLCRMLNHTSGRALRYGQFGAGSGPIWIAYLRCQGDEDSIFHCPMAFNEQRSSSSGMFLPHRSSPVQRHGCSSHNSDAGVQCYDSVRLVDSKDIFYGRLEMYINKTFTSVCDDGFTAASAKVVCNILGYPYGHKQCCSALGKFPSENITVTNVQCRGHERSLDQCSHDSTITRPCKSGKYVSVYCSRQRIVESAQEITVRIREDKYYGSLEANKYGFWSPVCNERWDDHDANVTCRQLGYFGGMAFKGSSRLQAPMTVGGFNCTGLERSLRECKHNNFGEDMGCSEKIVGRFTRTTAGVLCYQGNEGLKFRISGGRKSGRVEVFYYGMWGRVCNRRWDDKDARVFCRSLGKGFIDGEVGQEEKPDEDKSSVVWVDYVDCEGTEEGLLQCDLHWDPDYSSCSSATAICMDSVRLEKGDKKSHGVVQVYQHENWGTVCNHLWTEEDIRVTCRQLGYERGVSVCCGAYGYLYAKGVIDKVSCYGNETSLLNCTYHPPPGSCSQDYAAVACFNGSLPSYRDYGISISGSSNTSGAVELTFLNISGRVCADGWDNADATVACREMGYMKGLAYNHKILFGKGSPIWATNVNCTGNEYTLSQCPNFTLGNVKDCRQRFDAGVVCYSTVGVNFRLSGPTSYYGRVDMAVDGVWGTICNRYWDNAEASAFCRSIGFNTGFPYHKKSDLKSTDANYTIYEPNVHCKGKETSLLDCPHEGWKTAFSSACQSHEKDATVHCYNTVKLDTGIGLETKDGPVMYYYNDTWNLICDKDFDDMSARVVCRELGFVDGRSVCCSAYGKTFDNILEKKSLRCSGNENSITECLKPSDCGPYDMYASVICFNKTDMGQVDLMSGGYKLGFVVDDNKENLMSQTLTKGQIAVQQYGIVGRISSQFWDDNEAQVFCRSRGAKYGIAYQMAPKPFRSDPTYLMSDFNCTGSESSLLNCSFHGRNNLGNNTIVNTAAALCYNESGISYRIANGKTNEGRVELAFNGRWGTVCDLSWDDQDAAVFCRMMNFSDGYAISGGHFGEGTGPVWISHLVCKGTENSIHSCAHQGFSEENVTTGWKKCSSHKDDAGVHCVDKLRLNLGYNASMGAVELYHNKKWTAVCENGSNNLGARVICRTLGYNDGRAVPGSAFGNITSPIQVLRIDCSGNEDDVSRCRIDYTEPGDCTKYLSVYCSNKAIIQKKFDVKLNLDDENSDGHGEVMVKLHGIWGSVCMKNWTATEASVTCRQLGYRGGVPYLIPANKKYKHPMLMSRVQCIGNESSLEKCAYLRRDEKGSCNYEDQRAGVLCYRNSGIKYQFYPNSTYNRGRVEIQYEGTWGGVCDFLWDSRDAEVFCRSQGFKGGIEIAGGQFGQSSGPLWFTRVSCDGNEPDILRCSHSGFNNSGNIASTYERLCKKRSNDAAAWCFNETVEINSIRLADGDGTFGRVEVFLAGPNEWGTICDDYWDDRDATVVCRQLGFATGIAKKQGNFGRGSGPIWLDNMDCTGKEERIQECKHNGFNIQNCHHGEDSGVVCKGEAKTVKPSPVKTLQKEENLAMAITIPIIVILIVIIIVIGVCYWRQRDAGDSMKTTLVDNEIHDPSVVPSGSATGHSTTDAGGRVTLSRLKATFSKAIGAGSDSKPKGLSNPNYENMKNEEFQLGPSSGESDM